jgi:hypothetical protein
MQKFKIQDSKLIRQPARSAALSKPAAQAVCREQQAA